NPEARLGSSHPGGFHAGLFDGSVHFLPNTINTETLEAITTPDGGELTTWPL
ncbi:MAG TPA: hypothetical protein DEB39_07280, partial [Planctomycetaceae bacterium]|nr:hypothetical protein [Planctomycetaceae bacterium]